MRIVTSHQPSGLPIPSFSAFSEPPLVAVPVFHPPPFPPGHDAPCKPILFRSPPPPPLPSPTLPPEYDDSTPLTIDPSLLRPTLLFDFVTGAWAPAQESATAGGEDDVEEEEEAGEEGDGEENEGEKQKEEEAEGGEKQEGEEVKEGEGEGEGGNEGGEKKEPEAGEQQGGEAEEEQVSCCW